MTAERWRLFVGIFPPPELAEELGKRIESWKRQLGPGLAWVRPEKLHLTLCFLGNVEKERVEDLASDLRRIDWESLKLEISGLGFFPNSRRPRVVWTGLHGDLLELLLFQAKIQAACTPFIEKREDKPFVPHLTVARVKGISRGFNNGLTNENETQLGSWKVAEFRLVRSEFGREGGYSVVEAFEPSTGPKTI